MKKKVLIVIFMILLGGLFVPQHFNMPVKGAGKQDYNQESFWFHPWGKSVTHKGVDIFAKSGTELDSSVSGMVLYTGGIDIGGKIVVILGPKWRLHYFAHLNEITASIGWISSGEKIGIVGDSGNAKGKPPHVHYSIVTLIPHFWRIDAQPQGWKKMFYLNLIPFLNETVN